jgi:enterochelin esterase-like enzyme
MIGQGAANFFSAVFAVCVMATSTKAQAPVSPYLVQSDGSVRFELRAPNAKVVRVALEGSAPIPMTKGPGGVWSCTTLPLAPDLYGYTFDVDGVTTLDTTNPVFKPNLIWQSNMLLVPGNPPQPWEVQDVPHGSVTERFYKSGVIGDQRDYFVYTPPEYNPRASKKYPVLYLLHGYSDTAIGWTAVGKAQVILDNLIAAKKVEPMLVVMPLGYGVPGFASPRNSGFSDRSIVKKNFDQYRTALLTEVIPQVEAEYKVFKDKKNRAIAGLSMGGAETLYVGLNNLDKFSYIGAFSTGGLSSDFPEDFPDLTAANANRSLKEFYVACGTEDGLIGFNRSLVSWLKGKNIKVEQVETPGSHSWMVWRRDLVDFSQKLFK